MLRVKASIAVLAMWLLAPVSASGQERDLLFTGEVFSRQAQEIVVPLTNNWRANISKIVPEAPRCRLVMW